MAEEPGPAKGLTEGLTPEQIAASPLVVRRAGELASHMLTILRLQDELAAARRESTARAEAMGPLLNILQEQDAQNSEQLRLAAIQLKAIYMQQIYLRHLLYNLGLIVQFPDEWLRPT